MKNELGELRARAQEMIAAAADLDRLEKVRITFFGRKGSLTLLMAKIAILPAAERATAGRVANEVKRALEKAFEERKATLQGARVATLAHEEWVDITAPGTPPPEGHLHITTQAIREIVRIFSRLGFARVRYPEADWEWYAFEALNMPPGHPARDEWETFFIDAPPGKKGQRTLVPHISNTQVREMEHYKPPIRSLYIYKCYRRQSDVSHLSMFHQFETLYINQTVRFTELKGTIEYFVREFFGPDRRIRLRPFHFSFTEPSFEVDISCDLCGGKGSVGGERCRFCKSGWVELAGAGLVHPNVLRFGGIDPKKHCGYAFAFGVERTAMMRAGLRVPDIRILYENDLRFLRQF